MDNLFLESPLDSFSYKMDKKFYNKSIYDYYDFVETIDSNFLTNLLLEDFKYRFRTQLNILAEIYGQQGCGKSLFGSDLGHRIGNIYGVPFNLEENTLADFDLLDAVLHDSPFRSTFIVDEQPTSMFGYGSSRIMKSLKDYEEMCRYTQKNILYIAPSEREHSSYYVFKEDQKPSVERFKNEECLNCQKQTECLKFFSIDKFKTLCSFPFWERHGYPIAFNFMLITARKSDNKLFPRGYVRLPMIPPELYERYDKIKKRNIDIFERKESLGWVQQRQELREFQERFVDKLVKNNRVVSKDLIKGYLQDYFGGRNFTTAELDIFCAIVKAEILNSDFADKTISALDQKQKEMQKLLD